MAREWVGVAESSSVGRLKAVDTAVRGDDNLLRNNVSMSTVCLRNRRKTSRQKVMNQRRTSMSEWLFDVAAEGGQRRRRVVGGSQTP